ncbi:hypothetical protein NQ314_020781 [Rhamnusium bicolor]|uniref:C2H2-type domain-containing protein n=1 Tax=Rhamnusium bicolor TaxID=1586634 RepID=A0AAV8WKF4_9CUCU|nr:hypothetical protein NQ314_020781 [Rhamnusium bicolor]
METNLLVKWCRICYTEFTKGINLFGEEARRSFLHAKIRRYLSLTGIKEKEVVPESEVTEMEVRVDPMIILQCCLDENNTDNDEEKASDREDVPSDPECSFLVENLSETENYQKNRKPYSCSLCSRSFTSELALQNHLWSHSTYPKRILNSFNNVQEIKPTIQFQVDKQIERSDSSSNDRDEGEESDDDVDTGEDEYRNNKFSCPICGKVISTKGNLKVHLETHRPKGRYGCDICGRIFKTQCNLYRHKEYHGGIQYPCGVCGRVYPTNSTLRAHSITHSDLRPHKCPLCDKTFKRNQDLKFHINQHTGARPYQCPYCPKAFASSGNCFSHRKRMHPVEVERDRERAAKIMR